MSNLYEVLQNSSSFKKIKVDDLLFVQYTCDPGGPRARIWSQANYFTYVVSGRMTLKTPERDYQIKAGESYFVKKGAFTIPQFFEEAFCDLIIFMPDDFIRSVVEKYRIESVKAGGENDISSVQSLGLDQSLTHYYQSLFYYFQSSGSPSKVLLKLKFEELVVNILTNPVHQDLAAYFAYIHKNQYPSLREIVESNFNSNLSIAEFARLSARSLSTFRREFQDLYRTTPSKWFKEKRLHYCRQLLETTHDNIEEIAYEGGFVSRTHFVKCFRERFGISPSGWRKNDQAD
jgi:AraC-like DNA-binding protein